MTDFGRRTGVGDMLKSVYDPNNDGVLAVAQTQADMTKAVYDLVIDALVALAADHNTQHESGGSDALNVTGLTGTTPRSILGDATAGRVWRRSTFFIADGTNATTIKCTLNNQWNGDIIAATDNIGKDTTVGHFNLEADGEHINIANAGFTGDVKAAILIVYKNTTATVLTAYAEKTASGVRVHVYDAASGANFDLTGLVQTGYVRLLLHYLTDA